ncbi:MAG: glycosyltransferase [bacterium]|nr:glycosyltransferase [bacterium]
MKILIVAPYFYPAYVYGGPIDVEYQTGKAWVEQNQTVTVVSTNANGKKDMELNNEFPVYVAGMSVYYCKRSCLSAVSWRMLVVLFQQIKKTDIVALHFVYSFPTIPTIILCKVFKKELLWRPHGALQRWSGTKKQWLKNIWNEICKILLPESTHILFTSMAEWEECKKIFPNSKPLIVPNGVVVPLAEPVKIFSKKIRLLFLGRIDRIKGLENLLMAIRMIDQEKFTLDICGDGASSYINEIKQKIEEYHISDRVFMRGEVSRENLAQTFAKADFLVVPSHTENFGQVVVEALAHAVPVIASKGSPWEKMEEIGCGLWVENDPKSLAAAIIKMSKLQILEMGRRGRTWMQKDFDWSQNAKKILPVLETRN